jgi:hypothetical protein
MIKANKFFKKILEGKLLLTIVTRPLRLTYSLINSKGF